MTYTVPLERRPRFVFNDGTARDFTLSRPQLPWTPLSRAVGGSDTSGGGTRAAFVVRRDELLEVVLAFSEAEWADVRRMIVHGQAAGTMTFYPDAGVPATNYAVDLEAPAMGEEIRPQRREGWGDWVITIVLRKTDGSPWTDLYFDRET